jgi:hypothetical protein
LCGFGAAGLGLDRSGSAPTSGFCGGAGCCSGSEGAAGTDGDAGAGAGFAGVGFLGAGFGFFGTGCFGAGPFAGAEPVCVPGAAKLGRGAESASAVSVTCGSRSALPRGKTTGVFGFGRVGGVSGSRFSSRRARARCSSSNA